MAESTIGKTIPALTLKATEVGEVSMPAGAWTVLYFYPKDDTPGCTKQACTYRDAYQKFTDAGIKVYGVSMDDLDSHGSFKDKFSLNFPLLSDPEHKLADVLGVYGDHEVKMPDGREFAWTGLSRDSFVIDPEGKVVKEWRMVDPVASVDETYDAVVAARG